MTELLTPRADVGAGRVRLLESTMTRDGHACIRPRPARRRLRLRPRPPGSLCLRWACPPGGPVRGSECLELWGGARGGDSAVSVNLTFPSRSSSPTSGPISEATTATGACARFDSFFERTRADFSWRREPSFRRLACHASSSTLSSHLSTSHAYAFVPSSFRTTPASMR